MFGIPDKHPVPWAEFENTIRATRESEFVALEQKRYEKCPAAPRPGNDDVVGTVLVVWSSPVISAMKQACHGDWPRAYAGCQVDGLLKKVPVGSTVTVITESSDATLGFKHPPECTDMPQWIGMMKTMMERGIQFWVKMFDEEQDADCVKMRMLVLWEDQETMERYVSEQGYITWTAKTEVCRRQKFHLGQVPDIYVC
jgi:hypothetical protein